MCIDAIDSVESCGSYDVIQQIGDLNGLPVVVLDGKRSLSVLASEILSGSLVTGVKPMMSRVSLEYEHKRKDGSSDRLKLEFDIRKEDSGEGESSVNNERENRSEDIDSRDRDYGDQS
jgi:hypothetical protein